MTKERFIEAKKVLLQSMLEDKEHCPESIRAVRSCKTIRNLINVMNSFMPAMKHKRFPTAEYMRKYFIEELDLINQFGIYIDQEVNIIDKPYTWLFGKCTGNISSSKIEIQRIVVNDNSNITINALPWSIQIIHIKSNKAIVKNNKANNARQIIIR